MKNINLTLILFLFFAVSCKKNLNDSIIVDPPPPPIIGTNYNPIEIPITSSVVGIVIDENGQPVEGATISLKSQTQTSDAFGSFRFMNTTMNENGTFIQIEKDGYFKTGRRFFPTSSATHNVRIELIEENFNQSFRSSDGGTATFENGGEIIFSPNSIKLENGDAYAGEVKVALKWLDPTADATLEQMPGALQGVTTQGEEMALETYGMIAVELESPIGEPLNIAKDETAQIKMPVPSSVLSNAPNEIPLWSFNYQYGIWAEDGKAILENGFYVGEVDHFSFWNCDFPRPTTNLTITLLDDVTNEPLPGFGIKLIIKNSGVTGFSTTNSDGEASGKVPMDLELEMQVLNICNEVIFSQDFTVATNDLEISFSINSGNSMVISGEIIDCNGASASDGLIKVNVEGKTLNIPVNSNPFTVTVPVCQNTNSISVSGGNFDDFKQSNYLTFPVADSVFVGDLFACSEILIGYGLITIDSSRTQVVGPFSITVNDTGEKLLLRPESNGPDFNILVSFPDLGVGDYSNDHAVLTFHVSDLEFYSVQDFESVEILDWGPDSGDLISGKFSGQVENIFSGIPETVHASFEFSVVRE